MLTYAILHTHHTHSTKAAMKGVTPDQLRAEGSQIMLSNTYHLLLTPGPDIVAKMGGLQKFTQWKVGQ